MTGQEKKATYLFEGGASRLKLMFDEGRKMSGAEMSAMIRIRSELGGTGSGRARLGVKAADQGNASAQASIKAADLRAAYLARKYATLA